MNNALTPVPSDGGYRRRRSAQQEAAVQSVSMPGSSVNTNQSIASRRSSAHSNLQNDISFTLTSLAEQPVAGPSITRPTTPTMTANSPLVSPFSKQRAADEVQAVANMLASGDIQRPASAPPRGQRSQRSFKEQQMDDLGAEMMETAQVRSSAASSSRSIRDATASIKETALDTMQLFTLNLSDRSLALLFLFIVMWGAVLSLDRLTTYSYQTIATNSFAEHSKLALVNVVRAVVAAIAPIPFAVIADLCGRYQAFTLSMMLYTAGHIVMAASKGMNIYIGGVVLYEIGANALYCLQSTVLADMTSSRNRLFFQMVPQMPFLVFSFISSDIYSAILPRWRWGIALFAILGPVSLLPVVSILHTSQKGSSNGGPGAAQALRRSNTQQATTSSWQYIRMVRHIWILADLTGLFMLASSLTLILIPLTLASTSPDQWESPKILSMISTGVVLGPLFVYWETRRASHPVLAKLLLNNVTFWAGGASVCLLWTAHALMLAYFPTYLYVVHNTSNRAQQNLSVIYSFTVAASSLPVALVVRYTRRFKIFAFIGVIIHTAGLGIMIALQTSDSTFHLVASQIVIGLGGALTIALILMAVQVSVPHAFVAQAIAAFNIFPCVGNAVGAAVAGAIWSGLLPGYLVKDLASSGHQNEVSNIYSEPLTWIESYPIGTAARTGVIEAYASVWRIMMIAATLICAASVVSTMCMKNLILNDFLSVVEGVDKKQDGGVEMMPSDTRRLFGDRLFEKIEESLWAMSRRLAFSKKRKPVSSGKAVDSVALSSSDSKGAGFLSRSMAGEGSGQSSSSKEVLRSEDSPSVAAAPTTSSVVPPPIFIIEHSPDHSPGAYSQTPSHSPSASFFRPQHSVQRPSPLARQVEGDV